MFECHDTSSLQCPSYHHESRISALSLQTIVQAVAAKNYAAHADPFLVNYLSFKASEVLLMALRRDEEFARRHRHTCECSPCLADMDTYYYCLAFPCRYIIQASMSGQGAVIFLSACLTCSRVLDFARRSMEFLLREMTQLIFQRYTISIPEAEEM